MSSLSWPLGGTECYWIPEVHHRQSGPTFSSQRGTVHWFIALTPSDLRLLLLPWTPQVHSLGFFLNSQTCFQLLLPQPIFPVMSLKCGCSSEFWAQPSSLQNLPAWNHPGSSGHPYVDVFQMPDRLKDIGSTDRWMIDNDRWQVDRW